MTLPPGLHRNIPADVYHSDPCPAPSLSSGIAKLLVTQSPAHAWRAHPRYGAGPDEPSLAADLGTICHALTLGRGRQIEVIDAEDWRTKAAKDARDAARSVGKVPCLRRVYSEALDAVASAQNLLRELEDAEAGIEAGDVEVVAIWRDGPTWCRAMADIAPAGSRYLYDLKFTGRIAEPLAYARTLAAEYAIQAAFYPRGFAAIEGGGEREMVFVVVETEAPFSAVPFALAPDLLEMAREQVDHALRVWRRCQERDEWPGYPTTINYVEAPPWLAAQWRQRMEIEAFRARVAIASRNTDTRWRGRP